MAQPLNNAKHDPVNQASVGLVSGQTFSPAIQNIRPLGLLTFGFVVGDFYANCGATITTGWSAIAGVSTGFSACAGVSTGWSIT